MCGIAGYFGSRVIDDDAIRRCVSAMRRRGPDHAGWVHHRNACHRNAYLLGTRLGIIDLDPRANQPLQVAGKWLVFNGELYNYRELAAELRPVVTLRTESDSEVLLAAIDRCGWNVLDRFEGMWALAVYDEADGSLTLSRDRFGEKPLFLLRTDDGVFFASEPKALAALSGRRLTPNVDQLRRYLVNGYRSLYKHSASFFNEISEVRAGTSVSIDEHGSESTRTYWVPGYSPDETLSYTDAVDCVRSALTRSVELRLRADVPLAFCMSGGVDSNAIIAIAKKTCGYDVHGFTILSGDARYDERAEVQASVAALGCRHTTVTNEPRDFMTRLGELVQYHDAPVYTITYFAQWRLMEAIAWAGYRVAISGTAADELLTGYYDHHLAYLAMIRHDPALHTAAVDDWTRLVKPFVRNPCLSDPDRFVTDPGFREHLYLDARKFSGYLTEPWSEPFGETCFTPDLLRNRMLNELTTEVVPVILHEDDANAMYYSVENRSPYLDRSLVELCYRIPTRHLVRGGFGKAILRDAVRDLLPSAIVDNPRKVGFNASIHEFLDTRDEEVRRDVLSDSPVWEIVRRDAVADLLDRSALANSESKFLFGVLNCKLFLEQC